MNVKPIFVLLLLVTSLNGLAQNNTFSPFSRYGLGEMTKPTFAHNQGMGGAYIALRNDSTMPVFINAGNPAAYAFIRFTSLEVGGSGLYTRISSNSTAITRWTTNFAYGTLGFPVRRNGGACFGIMPYSNVGYDLSSTATEPAIGQVQYQYNGSGGLNKAFIGYGVLPFNRRLTRFRTRYVYGPDSLRLSPAAYKRRELGNELLNDLSIGLNMNYVFGNIQNITRVIYPNTTLYNNTYRERNLTVGDFTGNFGVQTAITIDSMRNPGAKREHIEREMKALAATGFYSTDVLIYKRDSMERAMPVPRRALKDKAKFTFGYFMALNNNLRTRYNNTVYNYVLGGDGSEVIRDTALNFTSSANTITLPLEQGFGIGFKKGERLNLVADVAITNWQDFRLLDDPSNLVRNYRMGIGANIAPNKEAAGAGAFWKLVNYRVGLLYETGYVKINNVQITDYAVTAGLGLPVGIGRRSSMVHIGVQLGQLGGLSPVKQNYLKFNFGFTFCDRWFQKYLEN